jgi:hypothetical protein
MDPRGGRGFTPPRRHVNPHLEGGGVGGLKPPSPPPPVGGRRGSRHPLNIERGTSHINLRAVTKGVGGSVVKAYVAEVGIANVVGKRHLNREDMAVALGAIHTIVGVLGIGGVKGGDTGGERGSGVHVADTLAHLL